MPSAFVKDSSGTWKHVKQQFVKVNDRWEPVKNVWIKENNTWKLGYSQSTGSVVYDTPSLGGIFKVPDDIYELKITYPDFVNTANNYVSTRLMTVTPGQTVNYSIGDYGQMSSFGNVAVAAFDRKVVLYSGSTDEWIFQLIGLVTGTNVLSTASVGTTSQLMADLKTAGIYYYQDNIRYGQPTNPIPNYDGSGNLAPFGDYNESLTCSIFISTIPEQYIQGPVQAHLVESPVIGGGTSIVQTQPSKENNYITKIATSDPSGDPPINLHYYQLNLRQVMPITVAWGDWPPEDLYPVRATITLVSVNGIAPNLSLGPPLAVAYGGNPIVYSMTTTNFTSGTLYYSISPTNVSIFDNVISSVSGNFAGTLANGVLHTSFGEINVINGRADTTFTIAASTGSFRNIISPTLEYRINVYKDRERTPGGFIAQSNIVQIIPPAGSVITDSYCGGPSGRFGGTLYSRYTVVANGSGGTQSLGTGEPNSRVCGYVEPLSPNPLDGIQF
jgi:hypothetical protein